MGKIRILLADDHGLVRASLRSLIAEFTNIEVVAEASDGFEAIDLVAKHHPAVILMDISMPLLNGLEATRRIVKEHPGTHVVVLSQHTDEKWVQQAMRAGASGYLLKTSPPHELRLALEAAAQGQVFLSPAISKQVIDIYLSRSTDRGDQLEQLTPRQREILQLVAEGYGSKRIAQLLGASVKTIESHRASLMERLNIHDVAGLVRFAIRHGLVSPES
jgi:DNA-binding NarL/FixJ family response regulator